MTGRLDVAPAVALTGATGFIGSFLLRRLVQKGCRLRLLLRRPEAWRSLAETLPSVPEEGAVEVIAGGLEDKTALKDLISGTTAVIHCAGLIKARDAGEFHRINADATESLVELAGHSGSVERFIYVSSLAAREPHISAYAESKRAAEEAVRAWSGRLEVASFRPPAVYGPGDRATLPLFQQMNRGLLVVPGRRDNRFSLIHAEDLVEAVTAALEADLPSGICLEPDDEAPDGYSWPELTGIAGQALGRRVRLVQLPPASVYPLAWGSETLSRALGRASVFTPGKLRELTFPDWRSRGDWRRLLPDCPAPRTFSDGFTQTLNWYKQQGWL